MLDEMQRQQAEIRDLQERLNKMGGGAGPSVSGGEEAVKARL